MATNARVTTWGVSLVLILVPSPAGAQHAVRRAIDGRPDATVDLRTPAGVTLVGGQWRYSDAHIVTVDSRGPSPDLRASGAPVRATDYSPRAGLTEFDDSAWPVIEATALEDRRTAGRLSAAWYRLAVTIPERVGSLSTAGVTVVFEIVADDYAEVWVDGQLPRRLGSRGGALVSGFNAPNRVVLTRDARPGQRVQLAVFAANGPLSDAPSNFVWIRSATLDFYAPSTIAAAAATAWVTPEVQRADAGIDAIVPAGLRVERLAEGFLFTEGPVWAPGEGLLFSDPNANTIYRWTDDEGIAVFRTKSGYAGTDIGEYTQPGSNGLAFDREGRLTITEHGNRRVTRLEKNGTITVLADRYEGRRLNSPNDLVYRSDGSLYFTDPPFGLPKVFENPRKELPFSGIFRLSDGRLQLLTAELSGPNGIALSPDEKVLYVGNWDEKRKVVMRYELAPDGTIARGSVFFDMTGAPGEDAIDGVKVDRAGHVYVSGPGGLWILSPEGRHLGTIVTPEHVHNMAWGGEDGRTLFLAARSGLYRMRLIVPGATPRAPSH